MAFFPVREREKERAIENNTKKFSVTKTTEYIFVFSFLKKFFYRALKRNQETRAT